MFESTSSAGGWFPHSSSRGVTQSGGSGKGINSERRQGRGLCRSLQKPGGCPFGKNCKFSHETSDSKQVTSTKSLHKNRIRPEQQRKNEDYLAWKRLIKAPPRINDIETIRLLWNGALEIFEGSDRETKQKLPKDLLDHDYYGLNHIETLLTMVTYSQECNTFVALAEPFLRVITHKHLLDCLSVDYFVGGLYNFVSGVNGSRAIPFFHSLSTNLVEAYLNSAISKTAVLGILVTTMTAICELLRRERRAAFHDDLPDVVDALEKVAEVASIEKKSTNYQILSNLAIQVRAIISRAKCLLKDADETQADGVSTTVVTSTYPRQIVKPGDRHDNDSIDIAGIKILPTEDEIRSNHPEFLPSTDPNQPHFLDDPAERHLDTHFRLLRHDIFGELKEALGNLMNKAAADDITILNKPKLNFGNLRVYPYSNAQIRCLSFDQRQGLQADMSFNQPSNLRGKKASERRKWWEDHKRLEEGILLCFIFSVNKVSSLLFLIVSERCTDPKRKYNLITDGYDATIVAKLATRNSGRHRKDHSHKF